MISYISGLLKLMLDPWFYFRDVDVRTMVLFQGC